MRSSTTSTKSKHLHRLQRKSREEMKVTHWKLPLPNDMAVKNEYFFCVPADTELKRNALKHSATQQNLVYISHVFSEPK
jgi:hypothetical protein